MGSVCPRRARPQGLKLLKGNFMPLSDLAFHTTQELIEELMRRQTFMGVVVHSAEEHKREAWGNERVFKVHFNQNLDSGRASRLLDTVAGYLEVD